MTAKFDNIQALDCQIGRNTIVHPTASIRGLDGPARRIVIGDNSYIGESVQILCDDVQIGDYSKIHHHTNLHGYLPVRIGHNAWIGQYCILDSIGGLTLGDNCCVGAATHLWSHIKFGDELEGCRFLSEKPLFVGDDVWFGGQCTVTPIVAADKSMALANSVITHDMAFNRVYAGSPAEDISEKIGTQFREISAAEKFERLNAHLMAFGQTRRIRIVMSREEVDFEDGNSYFVIEDRRYKKVFSEEEIAFMKFLLPAKAKFTPYQ